MKDEFKFIRVTHRDGTKMVVNINRYCINQKA